MCVYVCVGGSYKKILKNCMFNCSLSKSQLINRISKCSNENQKRKGLLVSINQWLINTAAAGSSTWWIVCVYEHTHTKKRSKNQQYSVCHLQLHSEHKYRRLEELSQNRLLQENLLLIPIILVKISKHQI